MKNVLNLKICIWKDFKLFFHSKSYVLDHSEYSIVLQGRGGGLESYGHVIFSTTSLSGSGG